ncbi:DUF1330 domain-containing protein [Mangrovimicrobium sediminis]|nr:DUF1330 domain-containing protein [Haliea sp. SAOS-164]
MTAYAIMDVDVLDIEAYLRYQHAVRPLLEKAQARYLARGGECEVLEGPEASHCLLLVEFPSMDALTDFYHSEEYLALEEQRRACSRSSLIAVRGLHDH